MDIKAQLDAWMTKTKVEYLAGKLTVAQVTHLRNTGFPLPKRTK